MKRFSFVRGYVSQLPLLLIVMFSAITTSVPTASTLASASSEASLAQWAEPSHMTYLIAIKTRSINSSCLVRNRLIWLRKLSVLGLLKAKRSYWKWHVCRSHLREWLHLHLGLVECLLTTP